MIGSIIGDIVGSVYEFNNIKTKAFDFFHPNGEYTDDSILTIATADWILNGGEVAEYYARYANENPSPMGDYGGGFKAWVARAINQQIYRPYNSFGNGSAMRVGPVGWMCNTKEEVLAKAKESAECTHNHPEGIKGAQATALAIMMARQGYSKEEIRAEIERTFSYNLQFTCDEIRSTYTWESSCQGTVPPAIVAFLDAKNFEDAIRNAISIGGDSDTLGCITGSIAEAYFGVPNKLREQALNYLPTSFKNIITEFEKQYGSKCGE
ncbi:MAG: ADP-ribosylglycohydrolase family protein [Bacteroidaceae bacterium]|nr:ADP-ribosylglycohydrolase family protein [Bacteroidaceae bacterium]